MDDKQKEITVNQIKEQSAVIYDIVKLVKAILEEPKTDTEKLSKITSHLGLLLGSAEYLIKKMTDEHIETISPEKINEISKEYLNNFINEHIKK